MDKRERRGSNNQSLVVGKKEGISPHLPHAQNIHTVPPPLIFLNTQPPGFWHLNLIHIRSIPSHKVPWFKQAKRDRVGQEDKSPINHGLLKFYAITSLPVSPKNLTKRKGIKRAFYTLIKGEGVWKNWHPKLS